MSTVQVPSTTYKGKYTHRSWPQLPQELVRLIATFYLWDLSVSNYCPQVWETREHWHSRMVYAAIRDAADLEKVMAVCPQWHSALETHLFWQQAVTLLDPLDTLGQYAFVSTSPQIFNSSSPPARALRLSPYQHFRNIVSVSCFVCRINSPTNSLGLLNQYVNRIVRTPFLGPIPICRDHHHRKASFCGLCLQEAPPVETDASSFVSCLENEDEDTWPGVEATCRSCRTEWLWRRVSNNPRDREAIGGYKLDSPDWETRQTVDGFIDLAEGTIADVITLAQEKYWLRKNTKLPDMMSQALAASRLTGREGVLGYEQESEDDFSLSEMEEDDEEDVDLMQMTEESGGIRELAINDWARNRILDGHWLSPADQWYGHTVPNMPSVVRAIHPCPWTRDMNDQDGHRDEEEHPTQGIARGEVPPSFSLCEQAYLAYQRQMRLILLPAMKNIVRKLVIECGADDVDPAMKAARMTPDDVLAELHDEAVWFDGIDWLEKRRNARREEEERLRRARQEGSDDSASSTASSKSDGSHTTSPVLSTTTLQTTPSPPPIAKMTDSELPSVRRAVTIAVAPVLDPPRLLRPIPYIPVTISHLPQFSIDSLKTVWREACAPLYHCRCKICERAQAKANALDGNENISVPSQSPVTLTPVPVLQKPVEIRLEEADGEGEDEEEEDEPANEEANDSAVAEDGSLSSEYSPPPPLRARKRSNDELDCDADDAGDEGEVDNDQLPARSRPPRNGTPPKRVKREGREGTTIRIMPGIGLSSHHKKRSSEELVGEDAFTGDKKRTRLTLGRDGSGEADSPPTSIPETGESDSTSNANSTPAFAPDLPWWSDSRNPFALPSDTSLRRGITPDLDKLYTLEDETL